MSCSPAPSWASAEEELGGRQVCTAKQLGQLGLAHLSQSGYARGLQRSPPLIPPSSPPAGLRLGWPLGGTFPRCASLWP